jgi:hypothetical protein
MHGEIINAYRILAKGRGNMGDTRLIWKDNIKMDITEVLCGLNAVGLG